jgi:hypothetical protein
MHTDICTCDRPERVAARHAAPEPRRRRLLVALVPVLVLLVGIGATTTALLLPGAPAVQVAPAGRADDDTAPEAAADAPAQAGGRSPNVQTPSPDEIGRTGSPGRVGIDRIPNPDGCPSVGCTMRYRVANRGPSTVVGLFAVRIDGAHLVASRRVTLPPGTVSVQSAWIPGRLLTAHPERRVKVEASFTAYQETAPATPEGTVAEPQGHPADGLECPCGEV